MADFEEGEGLGRLREVAECGVDVAEGGCGKRLEETGQEGSPEDEGDGVVGY